MGEEALSLFNFVPAFVQLVCLLQNAVKLTI